MGHYRSEMGFEREDRRRAEAEAKTHDLRAAYIKADIEKRGIEHVLADIVADQTLYSIRSHRG